MIRVAIVEDEAAVRDQLMGYVQRYMRQYDAQIEVTMFTDGVEILDILVGDLNAELVGQDGDHIDNIQAVRAEIVDDVAVGGDLLRIDFQLFCQIATDAAENLSLIHI